MGKDMHTISVAMTTYNAEKFLRQQLDSILIQLRPIDELVVCDDCSTDMTIDILVDFASRAPFPVVIIENEKNLGYIKNFEKAMGLCSGNIIVLCDHDDIWMPNKIYIIEKMFIEKVDCNMVFTDALVIDEFGKFLYRLWDSVGFNRKKRWQIKHRNKYDLFLGINLVTGATMAVSKSLYNRAFPFPLMYPHDRWLTTVAAVHGGIYFSEKTTIKYRKHGSQQIGCTSPKLLVKAHVIADYDEYIRVEKSGFRELGNRFSLERKQIDFHNGLVKFLKFRKNSSNTLGYRTNILINYVTGKYLEYANGFYSMAKDFFLSYKLTK